MIELNDDRLVFRFPKLHPDAVVGIEFQRTLRIPDDGETYPLPPGLGRFPLRCVDDFAHAVPARWRQHGGVMLPMYQSEALWIYFKSSYIHEHGTAYPFAIRVAAGKINAVTGQPWRDDLNDSPQDYLVVPRQPWLDGYCVEKGIIRQFVAMPLGAGYSAEEQLTGKGEHGGLQLAVYPMRRDVFERRFPKGAAFARFRAPRDYGLPVCNAGPDMGLAPGGRMRQEVYSDPFDFSDWERSDYSRCFVHIANSLVWRAITDTPPPTTPPTASEYTRAGLPWFDFYSDAPAVEGAAQLKQLKSILKLAQQKGDQPLPENEPVRPEKIIVCRPRPAGEQVREGAF